uniref:Nuclear receptor domain-containing protein n=1 Tax=Caenorhabditis japonica TaxID=281687 RepID=A0A8R1E3R8_CAEJA
METSELEVYVPTGSMVFNYSACQVCAQPAHGNHFGAISCRACAAFFRRAAITAKTIYKCKNYDNCQIWKNGRFICKKCRLVKCHEVGMDSSKFQFDRDPISTTEQFVNTKNGKRPSSSIFFTHLPETIEHFLGSPHFLLYIQPIRNFEKNFIDCQYLIEKASKLLSLGAEKPIFAKNNLEKLALGLNLVRAQSGEMQILKVLGKNEAMTFWEKDFLAVARWLTYFDDFQELPHAQQVLVLKSVWHVWSRLDKLALTASRRSLGHNCAQQEKIMMVGYNSAIDVKNVKLDISWFTKYTKEQLGFFFEEVEDWMLTPVLDPLTQLQPTDMEITYMLCQLCFHYAGKRFQGEILEVMERFQESLAANLHDYYVNELNMPRYCGRLNQMMKINNRIQQDIWEKRSKYEVAKILDIYCVEFSHPEMFLDAAA